MSVKRYLLFAGEDYYPLGGWHDFARDYATVGAAKRGLAHIDMERVDADWAHIVDSETGEIVAVWDDTLGWFRSMEERNEAANAAFVKRMKERHTAGQPPPFLASVSSFAFPVATSATLKL